MNIQFFCTFFCCLIFIYFLYKQSLKCIINYHYVTKANDYFKLLEYFCAKSYDLIYKKQIATFTTSGYTPTDEILETFERSFVKLTLDIMGIRNKNNLIDFFGGQQYLIDNIILYMKNKVDTDEILQIMKDIDTLNQQKSAPSK